MTIELSVDTRWYAIGDRQRFAHEHHIISAGGRRTMCGFRLDEQEMSGARFVAAPIRPCDTCTEVLTRMRCVCCQRGNEYNGYGSDGPTLFECPDHCACHD